jgi:hypothetical protein
MKPVFVSARIKIRDDNGPTDQLGEPQLFLMLDGKLYPLSQITNGPGVLVWQVVGTTPEDRLILAPWNR